MLKHSRIAERIIETWRENWIANGGLKKFEMYMEC